MADYIATDAEVTGITSFVSSMLGAPIVTVELDSTQYVHAFNTSIEEYSNYINQWAIKSHIANALGLPSSQDFTLRWVSQNFEFAKSFSKAYSEQVNVGGEVPVHKSYITLIENKQTYYVNNDVQIIDVMWHEPVAINRYLIDPNTNPAWVNHEFGWAYMGNSLQYVTPVSFTIQLANATEIRYRTLRGDFNYAIRPAGADAARVAPDFTGQTENAISVYPVPAGQYVGDKIWYFYKYKSDLNAYANQEPGDLVSNPGTLNIDEIPYTAFNANSQRWVKQYTLATCKEILGRIRSKFSSLPIPDAEVTLDGGELLSEAQQKQEELKEYLLNELEAMDVGKLIEDDATAAENINRSLSFNPGGIFLGAIAALCLILPGLV